ncbi:hypothetical protein BT69DRAFT_550221 [Atractiella rhizophila]|nr:hypothetical protein BT69DRAFT_550221 [Atractiella rhizophila]
MDSQRRYSHSPTISPQRSPQPSPTGKRSSFFSLPGSPSRSSFEVHQVVKKSTVQGLTDDELSGGECSPSEEKDVSYVRNLPRYRDGENRGPHLSAPPPVHINPNPERGGRRKPAPKLSDAELSTLSQQSPTPSSSREVSPPVELPSSVFTAQSFPTQSPTSTPLGSPKPLSTPRTEAGLASRFLSGFKFGMNIGRGRTGSDASISGGEDDNIGFQVARPRTYLAGPRDMSNNRNKSLPSFPISMSEGSGSESGHLGLDSDQKEEAEIKLSRFLDEPLARASTESQSFFATPWSPLQAIPTSSPTRLTEAQQIAEQAPYTWSIRACCPLWEVQHPVWPHHTLQICLEAL